MMMTVIILMKMPMTFKNPSFIFLPAASHKGHGDDKARGHGESEGRGFL
jgi:hypothetical protein